jgi:peptide methionine sulfoxide reductase msrA/msrB
MKTSLDKLLMSFFIIVNCSAKGPGSMQYNKLTPEEEKVIIHKSTEKPFTGKYTNFSEKGNYICKRCNAPLYRSGSKFTAHCGWPSFDEEIPGAVKRQIDPDGMRTELLCAKCGAHLGHVFAGEGFTPKNVRHCVNSISLNFIADSSGLKTERAIYAGGCFWGVEYYMKQAKGVISTTVGYIGGAMDNPSYEEVCTHTTAHAEAVEVIFDPAIISYEILTKIFFEIHDPTQLNRQGPDKGDQYRSAIFYTSEKQRETALALIQQLQSRGYAVVTEVTPAAVFWKAEEYHQDYYAKTGKRPYCHLYTKRF